MKLRAIELRSVHLPLLSPFRTSHGTESAREALVLRVESDDGEGWGECVAGSDPLYCPEYLEEAWLTLKRYLAPALLGAPGLTATDVQPLLHEFKGHRMAKAALEMAVLDAELRAAGVSFAAYLGGVADVVTPGIALGIMSSVDELQDRVSQSLEAGYRRVKLKICPGWDLVPVAAVRDRFGENLMLQVDANSAYQRADIDHLAGLDPFCLLLIEQPLEDDDLIGHAELARRITTPVCLDESIVSVRQRRHCHLAWSVLDREHQGGTRRRLPRGTRSPRLLRVAGRWRVVRWNAGDWARPRGEPRPRFAARLHPAGRHLSDGSLLPRGHHPAFPARRRHDRGPHGPRPRRG